MKAVVAAFNQEKALVRACSVITNLRVELFQALHQTQGEDTRPPVVANNKRPTARLLTWDRIKDMQIVRPLWLRPRLSSHHHREPDLYKMFDSLFKVVSGKDNLFKCLAD